MHCAALPPELHRELTSKRVYRHKGVQVMCVQPCVHRLYQLYTPGLFIVCGLWLMTLYLFYLQG